MRVSVIRFTWEGKPQCFVCLEHLTDRVLSEFPDNSDGSELQIEVFTPINVIDEDSFKGEEELGHA